MPSFSVFGGSSRRRRRNLGPGQTEAAEGVFGRLQGALHIHSGVIGLNTRISIHTIHKVIHRLRVGIVTIL